MSAPDVSVVIPAYNAAGYLPDAVSRLLAQSIPVQIVVVDDGSTDTTAEVMRGMAAGDDRVRFVALDANVGPAGARQAGVAAADGRFIWFVDADDEWADDGAERLLAAAETAGADVVCAGAEYVYSDGPRRRIPSLPAGTSATGAAAFRGLLRGRITGHLWNKLFAARLFDQIEFTPSRVHSDQAMVAQLLVAADTVVGIDAVIYGYRLRSGSVIRSGTKRAESLTTVGAVVQSCAVQLGTKSVKPVDIAYYTARFALLSRMKDATSGAYSADESEALVRQARREMTPRVFAALARERDAKRLALLVAARLSLPLYRRLMSTDGARS